MKFPWIQNRIPSLVLAPMEGVTDAPMRTLMTERGGISFCVSEFLRVTQQVYPSRVFFDHVPELKMNCKTPSGVPVQIQLLGGNEEIMALNALRACELGAGAIDLNFGCPSPVVNRHDGGAALLRYPERIRKIVETVRKAVPSEIPVSAKLRLGWECMEDIFVNAEQAALGGASWLTIHARTKVQGYAPPAHWKYIGELKKRHSIPIVANGDIWNRQDFLRCREVTGCEHFMIGRGALANPTLANEIALELGILTLRNSQSPQPFSFHPQQWEPILLRFSEITQSMSERSNYTASRIKQWLKLSHIKNPLVPWFDEVKVCKTSEEIFSVLRRYGDTRLGGTNGEVSGTH